MKALFSLNPYIWRYKNLLLLGILFVIAANLFKVFPAVVIRDAFNAVEASLNAIQETNDELVKATLTDAITTELLWFSGKVLLLALIGGTFLFFTRQTIIVMSRKVEYDLHRDLYDHFQRLSLSFYRMNRTGDLMARITEDVSRVRMYLGPGIMYTINTISLILIVVTVMFSVSWKLTLLVLAPLPVLSLIVYRVSRIIQSRSDRIQKQLSRLTIFTQEIFSGIRVVKAYVKEKAFGSEFDTETNAFKERSLDLARVDALFFPSVAFLAGLSSLLLIGFGGKMVMDGSLKIGNIVEFILYIGFLIWPIIAIGWVTSLIQRAAASQVRLNELLAETPDITFPASGPSVANAELEFENVSFTYPDSGIHAVTDVSFTLKPGMKLGILGPTGSGKTTLCAMIPRMYNADAGTISFGGQPVNDLERDELRGNIGYAPQDVFLFSDTIKENIAFGKPDATLEEVEKAAKDAGVHHNIVDFKEGFDTKIGERGVSLSGGQKQRIAIARAWVRQPKLLILDDVLSAVDTRTEETVLSNLRLYREEHTDTAVVMVAHRISCLQDADMIIVLEDGKITERGNHTSLSNAGGYYQRIYEKQLLEMA
ncbi:MAG: ABC transporter ATP-binding protein [Bacteroidia bacterium]